MYFRKSPLSIQNYRSHAKYLQLHKKLSLGKHADKLRITSGIVSHVQFGYGFLYTD